MTVRCPKCGSENISQLRQLTGPIWCNDCGFRVENKEINNPFIFNEAEELEKNDWNKTISIRRKIFSHYDCKPTHKWENPSVYPR